MAFVNIPDIEIQPDAPLTSNLAFAWRDNLLETVAGTGGAPKVKGRALDIAAGSLGGTSALVDLDNAAMILLVASSEEIGNPTTATVSYQLSSNNGTSWGAPVLIATAISYNNAGNARACASGSALINMVGFNAVRLSGAGNLRGTVVYVKGV